jgi:hypothetical protein
VVAVSLVRADGTLVEVVGAQRVNLLLDVPHSKAGIRGECLRAAVGGYLHIKSNFKNLDPVGFSSANTPASRHLRSEAI